MSPRYPTSQELDLIAIRQSANAGTVGTDSKKQADLLTACIDAQQTIENHRRDLRKQELRLAEWVSQLTPVNQKAFYATVRELLI